ncbi:MAG: hypothetical protein Q4P29_07885 [Tissierellia bacterium]|nr:hypothetical protein [Tissierellia bacterium]
MAQFLKKLIVILIVLGMIVPSIFMAKTHLDEMKKDYKEENKILQFVYKDKENPNLVIAIGIDSDTREALFPNMKEEDIQPIVGEKVLAIIENMPKDFDDFYDKYGEDIFIITISDEKKDVFYSNQIKQK